MSQDFKVIKTIIRLIFRKKFVADNAPPIKDNRDNRHQSKLLGA